MEQRIVKKFQVSYQHRLMFTENIFGPDNSLLADTLAENTAKLPVKLLFVVDSGVAAAWENLAEEIRVYCGAFPDQITHTETLIVPGGEASKRTDAHVNQVVDAIERNGICRHSTVIALGGGAVIDMTGYAAAIAHRGVRVLRLPTTVLAQNDAAVGVKNGINAYGKKNFLGTFAVPQAIINDSRFLTSLETRDWVAGTAEAVKVALIKDRTFFEWLEENASALASRNMEAMNQLIYRCAELHMDHIADGGDPFESGSSRPLDFGHWAAHKWEHLTDYSLRHGEAVAVGMALDVVYSQLSGRIGIVERDRILAVLEALGFNLNPPELQKFPPEEVLNGLTEFQEHLGGLLTITLLKGIGEKEDVHEMDRTLIREALDYLSARVPTQSPG
ncbi:3-dehydroquinate synthase [Robiginitalea myxolifaciens]|uniref:3-dehydroquinate synthase n=1 Tax=Robiginitalea myxolifaciens TaxID=400055 RepID=A0A1I6H460_9FLAO|nr:3-dehydroquinate synthase [Robiginitalea myxolifaciens]SFR49091.1 3-dehydroquinate synthase [Robiginitalea myxolifaciens]